MAYAEAEPAQKLPCSLQKTWWWRWRKDDNKLFLSHFRIVAVVNLDVIVREPNDLF